MIRALAAAVFGAGFAVAANNPVAGPVKKDEFQTAAHKTQTLATVRYAAPEMLSSEFGRVGPATDLYALGHIAYELALGTRAHRQQCRRSSSL